MFSPEFEEVHFSVVFTSWMLGVEFTLYYFLPHLGLVLLAYFYLWDLGGFLVVVLFFLFPFLTFAKLII